MKNKKKIKILIMIVIFITVLVFVSTKYITTSEVDISLSSNNQTTVKVIHLSDLHGKSFFINSNSIINTIEKEQPDFIICSGDMISSKDGDGSGFINILKELDNKYPVYYAFGNHDLYARKIRNEFFEEYIDKVEATGCIILDDEKEVFEKDDLIVNIYGLSSIPYYLNVHEEGINKKSYSKEIINEAIGEADSGNYNLLIGHDPSWFNEYKEWGADVVFSGHIHGGAIRLPILGGVVSPNRELFPKYDAGLYEEDGKYLYLSRGIGTSVERIRVLNFPEIAIINIEM